MATEAHAVPAKQLDEQTLLQRIGELLPVLRERAQEAEELRQIPPQTLEDVWATGYLSAFRTRHFGGPGLGLSALANGARILAHGCASTAWTMVFLAQHTWMFAKANLALQEELLGGERPGMQWELLAEKLADRWPDRWEGATGESVSAECRALGVPSVDVKQFGRSLMGCRREHLERVLGERGK